MKQLIKRHNDAQPNYNDIIAQEINLQPDRPIIQLAKWLSNVNTVVLCTLLKKQKPAMYIFYAAAVNMAK